MIIIQNHLHLLFLVQADGKLTNHWREIEGTYFNVLKNETEKVEIIVREDSDNNLQTVNILTQDSLDIKPKLKDDQIMKLAKSLDEKDIGYSINVSENDIKELLKA